jgi:NAD+ synthase
MDCLKVFNGMVDHAMNYFRENNLHAAILGISGGIDSTVVAYIFNEVEKRFNNENYSFRLVGISMPTETTDKDEFRISELVGHAFCPNNFRILDITQEAQSITIPYVDVSNEWVDRFRIGNVKSRLRMIHLYDLAKAYRGVVVGTDNYTEYLLGYSTIGGDGLFDYCPIQYLWKTEIYELANFFREIEKERENWEKVHALDESITIPPQAGLGITNTDLEEIQASSYWEVDSCLKSIIANEDFKEYIDVSVRERILDRYLKNQYKRKLPIVIHRNNLID